MRLPILPIAIGGALLLFLRKKSATAAGAPSLQRAVSVRSVGQDYSTPTAVAGILAQLVTKVTKDIKTNVSATAFGQVEAARDAVRAGDSYYGQGSLNWFDRTGTGAGFPADPNPATAWSRGGPLTVNPAAASASYNSANGDPYYPDAVIDTIPGGPTYSPGIDTAALQAFGW